MATTSPTARTTGSNIVGGASGRKASEEGNGLEKNVGTGQGIDSPSGTGDTNSTAGNQGDTSRTTVGATTAEASSDSATGSWVYAVIVFACVTCVIFIPMACVVRRRMRADDEAGLATPMHQSSLNSTVAGSGNVASTTFDPAAPERHFYPLLQNPTYAAPPSSQPPRNAIQNSTYQVMPQAADPTYSSFQPKPAVSSQILPANDYAGYAATPTPIVDGMYDELGNYGELQGFAGSFAQPRVAHVAQTESMYSEMDPPTMGQGSVKQSKRESASTVQA